jgi:hypothetical protein
MQLSGGKLSRSMSILAATGVGAVILIWIAPPGVSAHPNLDGPIIWCLLFYGVWRNLAFARRLLIGWDLLLLASLSAWGAFSLWGVMAFEGLLTLQVMALCLQEWRISDTQ